MSKQTKYKDLDDVKMEIKRTEVAKTRAKFAMLDHQKRADKCFLVVNSMEGMTLTEAMKESYHKNLRNGEAERKLERKELRAMNRAEIKLERLKALLGQAATGTFDFMAGDQSVVC